MQQVLVVAAAAGILLTSGGAVRAQDPCANLAAKGAALSGFAGAKVEALKSGSNTICEMHAKDRKAKLRVVAEPPQAASGVPMRRMLAANAKEPGMKVRDEPGLGSGAFSFSTREQVSFTAVGKGGVYTVSLNRDAGIAPGDEDGVRAVAKQLADGR